MKQFSPTRHGRSRLGFGALVLLFGGLANVPAASDEYLPASVRKVQTVLKGDAVTDPDLKVREETLKDLTSEKELRNSDLRTVLALTEWKDLDRNDKLRERDAAIRKGLIDRFEKWTRDLLTRTGPASRDSKLAAVAMIGEMGITVYRAVGEKKMSLAADFAPDLATLLKDPDADARVRIAAAEALGKINPEPEPATKALGELLVQGTPGERQAAAEGLAGMMRVLVPLIMNKSSAPIVEVGRTEAIRTAELVTNAVGPGLKQEDPRVRRSCLEALHLAAVLLGELGDVLPRDLPPPGRPPTTGERAKLAEYHREVDRTLMEVAPLAKALSEQVPNITHCLLQAGHPQVRYEASRTLSALGFARQRMLRKAAPLPAEKIGARPGRAGIQLAAAHATGLEQAPDKDDPLAPGLRQAVGSLSRLARDRRANLDVRLEALEALVLMGPLAAAATDTAIEVLNDPNSFIRWAAARLLGKIGAPDDPQLRKAAVTELTRRLDDSDLDVRKAVNITLGAYGSAAAPAGRELANQVAIGDKEIYAYVRQWPPAYGQGRRQEEYGDAEVKLVALRTLQQIGIEAIAQVMNPAPVIEAVRVALFNRDVRVREAAGLTLVQFGPAARSAVADLRQALSTEARLLVQEPETDRRDRHRAARQAIADAILAVTGEK
jgi:HEAT repeat protein